MRVVMEPSAAAPVGLLMQLDSPIFDSNVHACRRILEDENRGDAIGVPGMDAGVGCDSNSAPACATVNEGLVVDDGAADVGGERDVTFRAEEAQPLVVRFARPGAASIITKDSKQLTVQWEGSRQLEEHVACSMRYTVETQQVLPRLPWLLWRLLCAPRGWWGGVA